MTLLSTSPRLLLAPAALVALMALGTTPALASCPDWQLDGQPVTTDSDIAWTPQSLPVVAGGDLDLAQCGSVPGVGHIIQGPDFTITYDALGHGRDLEFRVDGACDTVLLVNDAFAQWHFVDDADNSFNPRLRLPAAASGIYDVWVGTYSPETCNATLVLETFPPSDGATMGAATCPDYSTPGQAVSIMPGRNFAIPVTAGGNVDLFNNTCGIQASGFVAETPDFSVQITEAGNAGALRVGVQAQCDTVLLMNDAQGSWLFEDDTMDFNPIIEIAAPMPGRYDVWVGTFGPEICESSVEFTWELAAPVGDEAAGAAPAPSK